MEDRDKSGESLDMDMGPLVFTLVTLFTRNSSESSKRKKRSANLKITYISSSSYVCELVPIAAKPPRKEDLRS